MELHSLKCKINKIIKCQNRIVNKIDDITNKQAIIINNINILDQKIKENTELINNGGGGDCCEVDLTPINEQLAEHSILITEMNDCLQFYQEHIIKDDG